jgi:hypothetical protein
MINFSSFSYQPMARKKLVTSMIFSFAVLTVLGAPRFLAKEVEPLSQTQATTSGVEISLRVYDVQEIIRTPTLKL